MSQPFTDAEKTEPTAWYNEKALIGTSAREMEVLLRSIVIRKKNKKLLENPEKVTFLNSKNNLSCLFG